MMEARLHNMATAFWAGAGHIQGRFPRDIESAVAWSLPLFIVRVPNLWVHDLEWFLRQHQLPRRIGAADRPLHGCVVAYKGKGLIVVDGSDDAREIRFTIAHEVAHFLLDYQEPRQRALEKFGHAMEEVLDGLRPPTQAERVDAVLTNAPTDIYAHFMHRDDAGQADDATLEAESEADRLALELIAPEDDLWRPLPKDFCDRPYAARVASLQRVLVRRFGLPSAIARKHAAAACRARFGGVSFREWLGIT